MKNEPENLGDGFSTSSRYSGKVMAALIRIYQPEEIELFLAKKTYKVTEYAFKITGWVTLLGFLKFIFEKTKSVPVNIVFYVLSSILFLHIFYSIMAMNFRFVRKQDNKSSLINLALNLFVSGAILVAINYLIWQTVSAVQIAK